MSSIGHWIPLEEYCALKHICANQQIIIKAAEHVCWFDWSGNDPDAVAAIELLRSLIGGKSA